MTNYADLHGSLADETCGRNGCKGIIQRVDDDTCCSCHKNPPCSHCTDATYVCPVCDWDETEEPEFESVADYAARKVPKLSPEVPVYKTYAEYLSELDKTKISWLSSCHSTCSMLKEGVYPEGTSRAEVSNAMQGTFGGRFVHFGGGKFKYIAYTD